MSYPSNRPVVIGQVSTTYGLADVVLGRYANAALAVQLIATDGEPTGVLSLNIPEEAESLNPGEFFAKTYGENESIAKQAMESGLFEDTGRTVRCGYLVLPVWRIRLLAAAGIASSVACHEN